MMKHRNLEAVKRVIFFRDKKAITIISLTITIIIMLILAGIIINTTIGENGLLNSAKRQKNSMDSIMESENNKLNELYGQLQVAADGTITVNAETLQQIIDSRIATQTSDLREENETLKTTVSSLTSQLSSLQTNDSAQTTKINNLTSTTSSLNNTISKMGVIEIADTHNTGNLNINLINNSNGYIYRMITSDGSSASPTSILGGNAYILMGFSDVNTATGGVGYGVQMAFGFGSSKIAMRNCNYNSSRTGSWSAWKAIE